MLAIVRHAESTWNALGKWTGTRDVSLTAKGREEARRLGLLVRHAPFDQAYISQQVRTRETLEGMCASLDKAKFPVTVAAAFNERDYGDYTGLNKWAVQEKVGEAAFHDIRRGWDVAVPHGETLKMVYARAVPYYRQAVVPQLHAGKNVLIVSHGNAIRALMKYIEVISDADIAEVEMLFGSILLYETDARGHSISKEVRSL